MILSTTIPKTQNCAFCDNVSILEEQDYQSISKALLVYYCSKCKNGFTTTESDTISVYRIQSAQRKIKRRTKRKEIIKQILGRN